MYGILNKLAKLTADFLSFLISYYRINQKRILLIASIIFAVVYIFHITISRPPSSFPEGETVTIEVGLTLSAIARELKSKGVIRSEFWFRNIVILFRGEKGVFSGNYFFNDKEGITKVARRVTSGDFGLTPIRVVIPEGSTANDIALMMSLNSSEFDPGEFLKITDGKEGYLFPDTYYFLPDVEAKEVAEVLISTFLERILEIEDDIVQFGKSVEEVITMASLLEKEALDTQSRKIVAGILWERLRIDMPLQVDAVFGYINGKNSFNLTLDDLKIDSPYNTYRYNGLPPTPIANPGLDSIRAAVTPIKTDYLFFLSDKSGNMHYSETFEEHVRKKKLYLN
jgi:UPF0755 protein